MPRRYKFSVVVEEGSDEFWESLDDKNSTGCEDVQAEVEMALEPLSCTVTLVEYKNAD